MRERRKRIMKRLLYEELERRAMMSGPPQIAMQATGLTTNSYEDFYKAVVGTEIGGPAGVGMIDTTPNAVISTFQKAADGTMITTPTGAEATTGVGQMVVTTGANTPGISSFAMPIAGPSQIGGSDMVGTAGMGGGLPSTHDTATDKAIESLFTPPDEQAVAADQRDGGPEVSERKTGRRSFDIDPEHDTDDEKEAEPAGANR